VREAAAAAPAARRLPLTSDQREEQADAGQETADVAKRARELAVKEKRDGRRRRRQAARAARDEPVTDESTGGESIDEDGFPITSEADEAATTPSVKRSGERRPPVQDGSAPPAEARRRTRCREGPRLDRRNDAKAEKLRRQTCGRAHAQGLKLRNPPTAAPR
jgi:hypothetical protein